MKSCSTLLIIKQVRASHLPKLQKIYIYLQVRGYNIIRLFEAGDYLCGGFYSMVRIAFSIKFKLVAVLIAVAGSVLGR